MGKRMDRRNEQIKENEVKKSKRSAGKRILRVLLVMLIAVVILSAAALGYGYITLTKISTKGKVEPKKVDISKPVNILVLGVDAGDYTNHTKNNPNRSDTMMLVRYNPITDRAYILSIPRDTRVSLRGHHEKLNAAHAIGGVSFTIKTIEDLLKVDINYYAEINYQGFRECIDSIGGVDIKIPRNMDYDAWKINIHFKKGEIVHMDGEKAEQFVRWRKNNDGSGYPTGDLGRISTQQEFVVEVIKKLKTPSGILRVPILMNTVAKYLETNMPVDTMLEYALKARGVKTEMVQRKTLPGEAKYIGGVSYYVWDENINDKFIANFRGTETDETSLAETKEGSTSSGELSASGSNGDSQEAVPVSSSGNSTVDSTENSVSANRKNMDVIILNSTGKAGLAAQYKEKLEKLGYRVKQTDNYVYKKYSYTIINDYSKLDYGKTLYNDLKFGNIVIKQKDIVPASLVVILGTDSIK